MKSVVYRARKENGVMTVQDTDGIYYVYLGSVLIYSNLDMDEAIAWVDGKN